ncbi:MAG: branched-chain amino acid ABC transporter permease [Candidatus Nanopelagicales bacterium]|jgi:branched-chain amino acid transport system permease protein|nr:branched-chain amino acid ABC transporter permease [Candidatus Nanopelagicales bacterium]
MASTTIDAAATPPTPTAPPSHEVVDRTNRRWALGFAIAALGLWAFYKFALESMPGGVQDAFQTWLPLTAVNEAIVWVICAIGLNIVVGYAGLLDLGFVAFWAIGGYCAGWFMSFFLGQYDITFHFLSAAPPTQSGIHINWWIVLAIAGAVCAFFGILIGAPTLRLKSDYLAIVTLGFGEIIPQVFVNGEDIAGFNLSNGTKGITPLDPITALPVGPEAVSRPLGPFDLETKYLLFALIVAFCVFVSLRIREGRLGRAWLAIREDELAASMMGVPLMRSKLAAYAVGAFMGGLGGVVFAIHVNGVFADRFNFSISIILLAMVVLGGMGNVWGVMIGALGLAWINSTFLPKLGETVNDALDTEINFPSYNFLIFGSILVLMMLFRREGLFPETRTRELVQEPERTELEDMHADLEGDVR